MFQVFCRGTKRGKWVAYSGKKETREEAEAVKRYAENLRTLSIKGNLITYKIMEVSR